MMVDIIKIGNSKGIRIPKALFAQCGFSDSVEIKVQDNNLVIMPLHEKRKGWDEALKRQAANNDDILLDGYIPTSFDEQEWEW